MIKEIPGWMNYLLLWIAYCVVGFFILGLIWVLFRKVPVIGFLVISAMFHAGMYMAKWRYVNGKWQFNGNLIHGLKWIWEKVTGIFKRKR